MVTGGRTVHGGARRARTDARLAEAVATMLRDHGYAGVTIEGVAAASGVAKTTIYRRWATKAEMVFDLAIHRACDEPPIDTGSLVGDVEVLSERAVRLVAEVPGRAVLPGLMADMAADAALTERLRRTFVDDARADVAAVLDRAVDRGDLPGPVDPVDLHAALLGIPYCQVNLFARTDSATLRRSLTAQLLAILQVTRGEPEAAGRRTT